MSDGDPAPEDGKNPAPARVRGRRMAFAEQELRLISALVVLIGRAVIPG